MNDSGVGADVLIAAGCLGAVAAAGYVGARFRPGSWYETLRKVPWNPPNWVFAPAWSVLYLMIAAAGWLIFARLDSPLAGGLWAVQLVLNALWSYLFFGRRSPAAALLDIVALLASLLGLLAVVHPLSNTAFWLLVPYMIWVAYALSLNLGIVWLNRDVAG